MKRMFSFENHQSPYPNTIAIHSLSLITGTNPIDGLARIPQHDCSGPLYDYEFSSNVYPLHYIGFYEASTKYYCRDNTYIGERRTYYAQTAEAFAQITDEELADALIHNKSAAQVLEHRNCGR